MAKTSSQAVVIDGLPELRKAFERIGAGKADFGIGYEVDHRLRNMGEHLVEVTPAFITHATGRHGDPDLPKLEDTLRVSVTQRRATVFTNSPYAAVQQWGGGPKTGWANRGPHVKRENASRFLTKAVASEREYVDQEANAVLDWIEKEWNT